MSTTMQVETFEAVEQTTDTGVAFDAEAVELIERLGLDGQRALLVQRETGGDTVTVRSPYRVMTAEEQRVYGVLCPEQTALEKYESSAIPLRILQVAAHATDFFEKIEVWHPTERVDDDPVLVGVKFGEKNSWGGRPETRYLLARWGAVLLPMDDLRVMAAKALRRKWEAKSQQAISEAEVFLASIDAQIERHLSGEYVSVPS
jgi:hypothetical protein